MRFFPAEIVVRRTGGTAGSIVAQLAASLRRHAAALDGQGPASPVLAMALTALWSRVLSFDAADPAWPDRDRFVMSSPTGAGLLQALLDLTGHEPEAPAPIAGRGQGLANAVGMALAERMLAARFGKSLVDHRVWVAADLDELSSGLSFEAAALAGQFRLDRLALLVDASEADADDPGPRFAALGWVVKSVAAEDAAAALSFAVRSRKPTLIVLTGAATAAEPGDDAAAVARWAAAGHRGAADRRAWLKRIARHPLRAELERVTAGRLPAGWHEAIAGLKAGAGLKASASLKAGGAQAGSPWQIGRLLIERLVALVPELVCGRAGTALATGAARVAPGQYGGLYIDFGARPYGMAGCLNGVALHGGVRAWACATLNELDEMRPALRLAAALRQRLVYLVVEQCGDGVSGRDESPIEDSGGVHERLAGLRAMPGLLVFRPGCALEAAECWELALRRTDGPCVLVSSPALLPCVRGNGTENLSARGGYVLAEAEGPRSASLLATGAELGLALAARAALLAEGVAVAVVSMPCWALFAGQDEGYRRAVLGGVFRVGIEAGARDGWDRWLGEDSVFLGQDQFRPAKLDLQTIVSAVRKRQGEGLGPSTPPKAEAPWKPIP